MSNHTHFLFRRLPVLGCVFFLFGLLGCTAKPDSPPVITLIVDEGRRGIAEVDAEGNELWTFNGISLIYDAQKLPSGNYLISSIRKRAILEIDSQGEILWKKELGTYPVDVDPLPDGGFLVAHWFAKWDKEGNIENFSDAVTEFDRDGNIVWEYTDLDKPWGAERLENGNTLIADSSRNRVIEVDREGKIVWEVQDLGESDPKIFNRIGPVDVQRLENGNTLVAVRSWNKVVEVDPEGKTVWFCRALLPYGVRRVKNGNTLIAENRAGKSGRVIEVNPKGYIVWEKGTYGYLAHVYRLE